MRSLIYPGLLGLSGAAGLAVVGILSQYRGNMVSPRDYGLIANLCRFSLGAGIAGAAWALLARKRCSRKSLSTLVISTCLAVIAMSLWSRSVMMPHYVGVPVDAARPQGWITPSNAPGR